MRSVEPAWFICYFGMLPNKWLGSYANWTSEDLSSVQSFGVSQSPTVPNKWFIFPPIRPLQAIHSLNNMFEMATASVIYQSYINWGFSEKKKHLLFFSPCSHSYPHKIHIINFPFLEDHRSWRQGSWREGCAACGLWGMPGLQGHVVFEKNRSKQRKIRISPRKSVDIGEYPHFSHTCWWISLSWVEAASLATKWGYSPTSMGRL